MCFSFSFDLFADILIGAASSAVEFKICAITAAITKTNKLRVLKLSKCAVCDKKFDIYQKTRSKCVIKQFWN